MSLALIGSHKWLMIGDEGGFCIWCKLFYTAEGSEKPGEFVRVPFTTYSKGKLCQIHESREYHKRSAAVSINYLVVVRCFQDKEASIS